MKFQYSGTGNGPWLTIWCLFFHLQTYVLKIPHKNKHGKKRINNKSSSLQSASGEWQQECVCVKVERDRSLLPLLSPFHFCQGRWVWHSIFTPLLFLLNIFIVHIIQTQNIGCCHKLDGEIPDKICQAQKTMNSFKKDTKLNLSNFYISIL